MTARCGFVYLVGGGPGDPGLITVRGLSLLRRADVVVHDRLAPVSLLADLDESVEIINVGKAPGNHRSQQAEIERILIDRAKRGMCVVRLKGGDPFVFGRGYEEMQTCRAAGVPCVAVPGVSSAFAAPSVVGIPITSRELVRSFAVLTASVAAESQVPEPDYAALAKLDTIVVLMGRKRLGDVAESFRSAGRDADTPVACIENATLPHQRVVVGTLATISAAVDAAALAPPVTTVIGKVAAMGDVPAALEGRGAAREVGEIASRGDGGVALSIAGRRVLVTRPADRSYRLMELLRAQGAIPISCPLTKTVFPASLPLLDEAIAALSRYDWLAFTSVNGVRGFWRRMRRMVRDARAIGPCRVAAVDATTADALRTGGVIADVVGAGRGARGLAARIIDAGQKAPPAHAAARVLFPCSDKARPTLPELLTEAGMVVDSRVAYHTVPVNDSRRDGCGTVGRTRAHGEVDVIVFYIPSSVEAFVACGRQAGEAILACIGSTTAKAATAAGLVPGIVSKHSSDEAMVAAIVEYFDHVDGH